MATGPPVEIILKATDSQDSFAERRFTLGPTVSTMPIGRASKSPTKPDLLMAGNNAYIDSPVVSREHAYLAVEHTPPTPHVYVVDQASMHGTYLNGNKLQANLAAKLCNGDVLQFGVDVARNDSFYPARKYVFESTLPNHFPRAFSVPENDSSEDEEIDVDDDNDDDDINDIMTSPAPRYGCQTNPVNVEDLSEAPLAPSPAAEDHSEADLTIEQPGPTGAGVETEADITSSPAQAHDSTSPQPEEVEDSSQASEQPAPTQVASQDHASCDEDDNQSNFYSEDSAGSPHESMASLDESDSGSDAEHSDSESDEADLDNETDDDGGDEADRPSQPRVGMMAMLNAEQDNGIFHEPPFAPRPSAPMGVLHLIDSPTGPAARRDEPYLFNAGTQANPSATLRGHEQVAPPMGTFLQPLGMFEDPFGSHAFGPISPVPPRPVAPRPVPWGTVPFPNPYGHPESAHLRMFSDEIQPAPVFMPNAEFPSEMFERYPGVVPAGDGSHRDQPPIPSVLTDPSWAPRGSSNVAEAPSSAAPAASEVQTPPPAVARETSSPPQPRRTKVSIPEIVDSPQQPPTPTSETASLKRKAEVLEDDESEMISGPSQPSITADDESATEVITEEIQAPRPLTPMRPIKKLRTRLQSAAKYTLGAAVAVALMSQIPDAFFEA